MLQIFSPTETPISDEDAKNFVMTPRFKDQIAWRTQKDQLKDLAKCLKEENREPTMDKIENDYKKTYNKCYALLTILMEEAGRNDWLYVKNCYQKVSNSAEIIKDMEVIINQHIQGKHSIYIGSSSIFIGGPVTKLKNLSDVHSILLGAVL